MNSITDKTCIITFAYDCKRPSNHPTSHRRFDLALSRLRASLLAMDCSEDFIAWDSGYPPGCPEHKDAPFAFKPYCFLEAKKLGYRYVLWLDSSVYATSDLKPIFDRIRNLGYLFFHEFHSIGEYCSDAALATLGIEREESCKMPSICANVMGLDLENERSVQFLDLWKYYASDGVTFKGAKWSGVRGFPKTVSQDDRVKGHRHDQTAASVIALKLGMNQWLPKKAYKDFFFNDRGYTYLSKIK